MKKNNYIRGIVVLLFLTSLLVGNNPLGIGAGLSALILIGLINRRILYRFGPLKLWIFPLAFVCFSPFLLGEKTTEIFGLNYSVAYLKIGLGFIFRAYLFVVVTNFIIRELSMEEIAENAKKIGMPSAGLRIALALSVTKTIQRNVVETWRTYRLCRPRLFSVVREIHIYLGAVVRNSARVAEQVSELFYLRNVDV